MPADPLPCASGPTLYPAVLLLRWLHQQRQAGADRVRLQDMPFGNASLPDLLRAAGLHRLEPDARIPLPTPFRWEGSGGGRVIVARPTETVDTDDLPLHHGALPCTANAGPGGTRSLHALVQLARLEDATAALTGGDGAHWQHILDMLASGREPRIPPLAGNIAPSDSGRFLAWNPLPLARPCLISVPLGDESPPWSLRDEADRVHPAQVVEGPLGRELLTSVRLGALQAVQLHRHEVPMDVSAWEVSEQVLDNGIVRAEFDTLGQIVRLSHAHVFQELAGPFCQALRQGSPLGGDCRITVLERGPVRGRVAVTRDSGAGRLQLTYSCYAGEDILHVQAHWRDAGGGSCLLEHPTGFRRAALRCGDETAQWHVSQAATVIEAPPGEQVGCRWAELGDEHGPAGLGLVGARPLRIGARAGRVQVLLEGPTHFVLCERHGSRRLRLGLAHLAQHLPTPGRASDGTRTQPPLLRLADAANLVPLWIRRPEGWRAELLLREHQGRRGRAFLYVDDFDPTTAQLWRVDAGGEPLKQCDHTPEADGFQIGYKPYEFLILRWR